MKPNTSGRINIAMEKKKTYKHIDQAERKEIALLLGKAYSLRDIAKAMNRSVSSILEEIRNNSVRGIYDPEKAAQKAYVKRKYSKYQGMKIVQRPGLRTYIEEKLKEDWSPEQISGRIKRIETQFKYVSPKAIYYVYSSYGKLLGDCLRYKGKGYEKREGKTMPLMNRVFIDQRPKYIDKRLEFGDWEGDFIVSGKSGQGFLLVLHERKARYTLIKKLTAKTIDEVHRLIFELTGGVVLNSLTLDNDIVFRRHRELSRLLGKPIYFCHPYHSWEKGAVENTNKLIRQYIPKGADISKYSDEYIQMVEDRLNNRPRECLESRTPNEVMRQNNQFTKPVGKININLQTLV